MRQARARVAGAVRTIRDRRLGAAATPLPAGLAANRSTSLVPDAELWRVSERYRGRFQLPPVSYGTVRDYADSRDALGGLAAASFDMKNLQRCWAVKAILGNVEPGGRVVEIGAGEPLVAGVLSRLGYRVTVVDPYDGSGNGPLEYRAFKRAYPELGFVRDRFPPRDGIASPCAAVYSISVLEHVPAESVEAVVSAARELVAPGGCCIHAIDHVVRGWGAEEHAERLRRIVAASGLDAELLQAALREIDEDPEAYFVSAEAHDRWRGSLPYDDYPMRRIASINLFTAD
jgi:SAM-dependent methyltransferase